ncbi:DUF4430 domain-containing protein [Tepidanaerobacter syntrophicus]|uniref:DUF4430 domain-containing protein n=1 Tax=Tepidanaerobacter syntrophicus TaxID=224999 RepID=UPI001BD4E79F|nr:DUF4430 domain-containing protein [Tepidanaerobacter syntrophicus]
MKITKNKVLITIAIVAVLVMTYWWGGNAPGLRGWKPLPPTPAVPPSETVKSEPPTDTKEKATAISETELQVDAKDSEVTTPAKQEENTDHKTATQRPGADKDRPLTADEKLTIAASLAGGKSSEGVEKGSVEYSKKQGMLINETTGKDKYLTDPVPEGKPVPVEPQDAVISDKAMTCTLSVRCDTILDNIDWLDKEKVELVPEDGVIFPTTVVTFYEGESVFNVLHREMKKNKIHMEFKNTPMYNSTYIEGINNLYEFDCGELSGWMYKVNGWFPNYGCSRYQLKDGDVVEWVYTCDLGVDVGGYYSVGGK